MNEFNDPSGFPAEISASLAKLTGRVSMALERQAASDLTLRDKFAVAALPAIISAIANAEPYKQPGSQATANKRAARLAYKMADAMMARRAN